ncbi:DUF3618 domain-containing protein [Cryptosporangium aurantiacum]|uniref:DUF3618 domain-containing protein n=1 Tax=Cryptosporangium aurantiacum TaxID=134849 RepID=A0A1M7RPK5_9ACTN|nr:DUF3618 domain-containing protein [Cryptosporangium aurantiacum]SHN48032.1 Protein of unknown function [Cryptosporangium aurantiacum]
MSSDDAKKGSTAVEPTKDPDALRAEIAEIRAELGDTVEALAAKADVKAQAQAKVEQTKDQLREKAVHAKEQIGHTAGSLRAKATDRTVQLRERPEVSRAKDTLSRYAPWPQVAAGAAATLVVLVLGGRKVRARRASSTRRTLRKVGRR